MTAALVASRSVDPRTPGVSLHGRSARAVTVSLCSAVLALGTSRYTALAIGCLAVATAAALVAWHMRGLRLTPVATPLVVFTAWYLLIGFASGGLPVSPARLAGKSLVTESRWLISIVVTIAVATLDVRSARVVLDRVLQFGAWFATVTLITAPFVPQSLRRGFRLYGFASSHHAPGMLFGALLIATVVVDRGRTRAGRAALFAIPVALSDSRTAMLAVGLVAAVVGVTELVRRGRGRVLVILVVLAGAVLVVSERSRQTVAFLLTPDATEVVATSFTAGTREDATEAATSAAVANTLVRFRLYGTGLRYAREHWLLGLGPGHYNDISSGANLWPGEWWSTATIDGGQVVSEATTHNMFVHVLVESGIVGLGLLWWIVVRLLRPGGLGNRAADGRSSAVYFVGLGLTSGGIVTLAGSLLALPMAALLPLALRGALIDRVQLR